ncbi:MAG: glutamine--fructose-6-phosphate transaminase (isomerizing) [bacterium]
MCGIVGYIGRQVAVPILVTGLKRLEYRGYDSAGTAVLEDGELRCIKAVGRIASLESKLNGAVPTGHAGIAHTRWATHGAPTEVNAHPHFDCTGRLAVVHNGIIENYQELKGALETKGHRFVSETDTEVVAHLVEDHLGEGADLETAVREALKRVIGTFGLAVLHADFPDRLVAARSGSPLIVGVGDGENFVASDLAAVLGHTRQIIYLEDDDLAVVTADGVNIRSLPHATPAERAVEHVDFDVEAIEKAGYDHFMQREIFEQPASIRNAMRGRIDRSDYTATLGALTPVANRLRRVRRVIITACGTSWHASLIGECLLEEFARIPVEVEYASEFRYRNPIIEDDSLVVAISQSGETADTLAALREAKRRGALTLAICNVVASTIAREADACIYLHAGPEIGVASTKAFTSQLVVLHLLNLYLARMRGLSSAHAADMVRALEAVPAQVEQILAQDEEIRTLAERYEYCRNFLYLGRGYNFPVALEGALKLKEISYIHAEGYPAAEMKHGPIALIDRDMPTVCIAPRDSVYDKIAGNVEEVKARGGRVILVATRGDRVISRKCQHVIHIPEAPEPLVPFLSVVPLQLLAYHIAVLRGCDVDKPRNLAKSVTVE